MLTPNIASSDRFTATGYNFSGNHAPLHQVTVNNIDAVKKTKYEEGERDNNKRPPATISTRRPIHLGSNVPTLKKIIIGYAIVNIAIAIFSIPPWEMMGLGVGMKH